MDLPKKQLTAKEIDDLPKGFHLYKFPNRKKRREQLQKDRSRRKHIRLLCYPSGKVWQHKQLIILKKNKQSIKVKEIIHFTNNRPF